MLVLRPVLNYGQNVAVRELTAIQGLCFGARNVSSNDFYNRWSLKSGSYRYSLHCFIIIINIVPGSRFGLGLTMNIEQYEYMRGPQSDAGIKVV